MTPRLVILFLCVSVAMATACSSEGPATTPSQTTPLESTTPSEGVSAPTPTAAEVREGTAEIPTTPAVPTEKVRTGAEILVASDFELLDGQRVGLISHQNSIVDDVHLADLLHAAPNVELVALFGPEHGARGDRDAGEWVDDAVDPETGVTVYSLFGQTRQPTTEMLEGVDTLLFDLQDVGARYYTYISTMGLAMQVAASMDIEFVVLDRPNPLGETVAGGVLDPEAASFVGLYPIPDTHGLTTGELAIAIKANGWLDGLDNLRLRVIEMSGWDAWMRWPDTGLDWVAPSPALTTADSALLYPSTVYLEATSMSYGRGTDHPFTSFGAPWLDAEQVASELNARALPGVAFQPIVATPTMRPAMSVEPAFLDESIPMVDIEVTDHRTVRPVEMAMHILELLAREASLVDEEFLARPEWLDQLSGSTRLRLELEDGASPTAIIERQRVEAVSLSKELERHHLYARSR